MELQEVILSLLGIESGRALVMNFLAAMTFIALVPFSTRFQAMLPRVLFAVVLALIMSGGTGSEASAQYETSSAIAQSSLALAVLQSLFWGALCALPLLLTVELMRSGVGVLETIRGHNIEGLYSPSSGEQETPLELLVFYVAVLTILSSGMFEASLKPLMNGIPSFSIGLVAGAVFAQLITLLQTLLLYAAPVFAFYFLTDFGVGVLSRQLPRMMLMSELYVAKVCLTFTGLFVLFLPNVYELTSSLFNSLFRLVFSAVGL